MSPATDCLEDEGGGEERQAQINKIEAELGSDAKGGNDEQDDCHDDEDQAHTCPSNFYLGHWISLLLAERWGLAACRQPVGSPRS